jgi:hypothetical protein
MLIPIDARLLMIFRWIAISGLIFYAINKKSLTTWFWLVWWWVPKLEMMFLRLRFSGIEPDFP